MERRGPAFVDPGYPSYDDYLLYLTIALDWQFAYERADRDALSAARLRNLTNVLLAGNVSRARLNLLEDFVRRFPEVASRLGRERRRSRARLLVGAAAYESHLDRAQAMRSAWAAVRQHPPAALAEAGRGARIRLAAARRS